MNIERTEREKEWKNRETEKNGFSISSKFFFVCCLQTLAMTNNNLCLETETIIYLKCRQINSEMKIQKDRGTEGQRDRRTEGQKDRGTEGQKESETEREKERRAEGQKDSETEGQ
jgi:hypothetical protein